MPDGDLAAGGRVEPEEADNFAGDADGVGVEILVLHRAGLHAGGSKPFAPRGVVILDQADQLTDLAEVEVRLLLRFLAFLRRLEPHAGLLSAEQGDRLGDHVAAPQVDKARAAEGSK